MEIIFLIFGAILTILYMIFLYPLIGPVLDIFLLPIILVISSLISAIWLFIITGICVLLGNIWDSLN